MEANKHQVGGDHYKASYQHWDWSQKIGLCNMLYAVTKYATRWRKKSGRQDIEKAMHYVQKQRENQLAHSKMLVDFTNMFIAENNLGEHEALVMKIAARYQEGNIEMLDKLTIVLCEMLAILDMKESEYKAVTGVTTIEDPEFLDAGDEWKRP